MYIKNIIISNFRSYREQSFPEGLSNKTNVIVGKNGSGKSNFFSAVQFVLNEKFSNLGPTERKELFHVGSGRPSLSIFVEIVFDNSDGRLVIPGKSEEPEVRIRRTVGLKQDEFRVNDRKFTAEEVHQLLESAGFSSSNPYYIVEQGKIVNLVNMSEEERYYIIKDVAGTQVYEARKRESEKILTDTDSKLGQVDDSMKQLEKRLQELESETKELKEYQDLDREKRCIEYSIFNTELKHTSESLQKLEQERHKFVLTLKENQDLAVSAESKIDEFAHKIEECNATLLRLEAERKIVEGEISALNGKQAVAELNVNEASAQMSRGEKERIALLKEKEQIESALQKAIDGATAKRATFEQKSEKAKLFLRHVEESQKKIERMQEKRNRTKLFKSKGDRDAWIQDEIKKNEAVSARAKAEIDRVAADISRTDEELKSAISQKKSTSNKADSVDPTTSLYEKKLNAAYVKRDKLNQERRKQWQAVHEQEAAFQRIDENAKDVKRQLDRSVRYDIRQGLQSLQEILAEMNDKKISASVFGPLIDLITVEEGYETAVDITAGNTLFNVLVDNFDTSALLLQQMNKRRKPGRISFFPLDTCNATPHSIPTTPDSSSLMSKIKFDKRFQGVVAEVFGRTAVVTSLDVGTKLSKEAQCDVVTIDGDQLGRRGGITGGYIDKRNSKILLHRKEKNANVELVKEKKKLDELCQSVASTEQEILQVLNEIELIRTNNVSVEKQADLALREARLLDDRISRLKTQRDQLLVAQRAQEKTVADAQESIKQLQEEKKEDYKTSWSEREENELELLSSTLSSGKLESSSMQAEVLQLGTEVQLLEDTIQHLGRRKQFVDDRIKELAWSKQANRDVDREHTAIKHDFEVLSARLDSVHQLIEKVNKEKLADESKLEALNSKRLQTAVSLQERKDTVDRTEMQRTLLVQRREDALQKLKKLGVIPKGVEKFASFSIGKLMYNLKETNEKLKKFSHVNRKALDQHTALLDTKNDLSAQRESLSKEKASICELMDHLEKQKHEAIERTYKQIQFQFEEVFKELVATDDCVAELQLVKPERSTQSDDPYIAARVRVSFGQGVPAGDIGHLSGGQKSLVALALIFAIQRCDPAPFYLFDEIDAALDAEYRTSVAKMIRKQSENCQFIIASFKTEIVTIADVVLGIFFHNKVSRVQAISQEEGVKLLRQAAEEDRKRSREPEQ